MAVEVRLQASSPEIEYATVARWLKGEGDAVAAGEPLVEVELEKVTEEVEAPTAGVLETILAVEGDEVKVGDTLAVIAEGG